MARRLLPKAPTRLAGEAAIRSHAHKRMDRMTLTGLSLLKVLSLAGLQRPKLALAGATLQAGKGVRADRTEAAHNLPRDLLVDGRSFWTYASEIDAHPRIRLQIGYAAAATMTVRRECNFLDSAWERAGLPDDWLVYLEACVRDTSGLGAGTLGTVTVLAQRFKEACVARLAATADALVETEYYRHNEAWLAASIETYEDVVGRYDPAPRLERMWQIYQLGPYV